MKIDSNQGSRGADAFTLKLIALLFMLLDHVHTYLCIGPAWISLLPRFVAPLFVFFLTEGFFHTRSREKYFLRMLLMAAIMFAGNAVINLAFHNTDTLTGNVSFYSIIEGNNILWTLAVYLGILMILCRAKACRGIRKISLYAAACMIALFSMAFCEGGIYLLPVLLLCLVFHEKKEKICIGIAAWSAVLFAKAVFSCLSGGTGISLWDTLCFDNEWAMISVIVPILLYNGKRGIKSGFSKWMFYIFYPIHLWILKILAYLFIL